MASWHEILPLLKPSSKDDPQKERRKQNVWLAIVWATALSLPLLAILDTTGSDFLKANVSLSLPAVSSRPPEKRRVSRAPPVLRANESWPFVCLRASAESGGFLSHCDIPSGEPREMMGEYVGTRMSAYSGRCSSEALQFHCLEYAARQKGWCDWSRVADASPIKPESFLNRNVCESVVHRSPVYDKDGKDGHKIVFFYPSYGHLEMLKRSITALQHPNHIFLIQVDQLGFANESFVEGVLSFAGTVDNVCVARYDYVLYITASQALIMWPAMAWAEGIEGWTHFFLMGAQTYPIVPLAEFRSLCGERRDENFFSFSLFTKYKAKGASGVRRYTEILPYCKRWDRRGNSPELPRRLGPWVDTDGNIRGPKSRTDWLEIQLGTTWQFAKSPGVEVIGATRDLVTFLLHDGRAKMFKQYFTYTAIACEHMIPSIVMHYFNHTVTHRNACFMAWTKHSTSNKVLEPREWSSFADSSMKYLFARKFTIPGSEEMLERVDKELRHADVGPN